MAGPRGEGAFPRLQPLMGDVAKDVLSIRAVHRMRDDAVSEFLARAGADWPAVQRLIAQGQLIKTEYEGKRFYMRRLHQDDAQGTDEAWGDA